MVAIMNPAAAATMTRRRDASRAIASAAPAIPWKRKGRNDGGYGPVAAGPQVQVDRPRSSDQGSADDHVSHRASAPPAPFVFPEKGLPVSSSASVFGRSPYA